MKTASTALQDTIKKSHAVFMQPVVIAEWNQNRYNKIVTIDNVPAEVDEGYDPELFPISSIVATTRPDKQGIVKARVATSASDSSWVIKEGFQTNPGSARYYCVDTGDLYKYWCSPVASSTSLGGGQYGFTKTIQPRVVYDTLAYVNKIKIVFESTYAKPVAFTVQITTDGSAWTTIATNPSFGTDGVLSLYRQSNGTWSSTVHRDHATQIKGLRLNVTSIDKNDAFFNLIELSPRLELDLTDDLIEYSETFSVSEDSFITPIGKASSNTASVVLSNFDKKYNDENGSSMLAGLIDKNVRFTVFAATDTSEYGGSVDITPMSLMYADSWEGQAEDSVTVDLKDYSKFMQEVKPLPFIYQDVTVGEIVWTVCDSIGFANYIYESTTASEIAVPYFWTDGEATAWEIFSRIAEMTQTAIYFDELGQLRIKTRDVAYSTTNPVVWTLDAVPNGSKLPDIEEAQPSTGYEANRVKINYKNTRVSDDNKGFPQMETIWQPEDTLTLRSAQLVETLTTVASNFKIHPDKAKIWPYEGLVQIDGEFIRFKGKGYNYYNSSGVRNFTWVKSLEEQNNVDKNLSGADQKYRNGFTGHMLITERGEWNTNNVQHSVDASGWYNRHVGEGTYTKINWNGGFIFNPDESTVELRSTTSRFDAHNRYLSTVGAVDDQAPTRFGTSLYFGSGGYDEGIAGIVFWNDNQTGESETGYYVEIIRTKALGTTGRKYHNELNFYVMYNGGNFKRFGSNGGLGVPMAIEEHKWYDIDVFARSTTGGDTVTINVNGITSMVVQIPPAYRITPTGRHGLFTRASTRCAFQYFYAVNAAEPDSYDAGTFFDKVRGGWVSGQWDREWTYNWASKTKIVKKKKTTIQVKAAQRFFDDFGPYVHEVREFDVKFEKAPVLHSQLYFSNDYQVFCPEYEADAFGAKFVLANHSRVNAIVNGEDNLTFGIDNAVEQKALIYGRLIYQEEEKSITVEDEESIRARGPIEIEISSDLIQSEQAAKNLGEWITTNWSEDADQVDVTVFGNPLFQLTDKVSINYPQKNMTHSTHHYYVVGISNGFQEGLNTRLTLRRQRLT